MSSITDLIRKEIENLSTDATRTNVGTIATLLMVLPELKAFQGYV